MNSKEKNISKNESKIKKSVKKSKKNNSSVKIVIGYENKKNLKNNSFEQPKKKKGKKSLKEKLSFNDNIIKKIYLTLFFLMMIFIIFLISQLSKMI